MFDNLTNKLQEIFDQLGRRGKLTEQDVDVALRQVRVALLEADVHLAVVKDFIARVRARAVGAEVLKSITPGQMVVKIVHDELIATLGQPGRLDLSGAAPHVVMLVGLQGSGKTSMAAKLALNLRKQGQRPLLVAADTYRPAAIDQLVTLARQLNLPVHEEGNRVPPPQICAHAVRLARENGQTLVILDTAGRLHIDETMMAELRTIQEQVRPQETLLVVDAMTGQDAVRVAGDFHRQLGLTGLVMTKIDGDARGGAAISVRHVTGVPIKYLGTGERPDQLELFHPERLAGRILGMGDILTLVEQAQERVAVSADEAQDLARKMTEGRFTLDDFLKQLQQVKRMGPLAELLEKIPGFNQLSGEGLTPDVTERELKKVEAIISSMTVDERRRPEILNASRRRRIARGSGVQVQDVNELMREFRQMQRMMKQMTQNRRGLMNMFRQ
jgi:signal recognition particle subunit SRP54